MRIQNSVLVSPGEWRGRGREGVGVCFRPGYESVYIGLSDSYCVVFVCTAGSQLDGCTTAPLQAPNCLQPRLKDHKPVNFLLFLFFSRFIFILFPSWLTPPRLSLAFDLIEDAPLGKGPSTSESEHVHAGQ